MLVVAAGTVAVLLDRGGSAVDAGWQEDVLGVIIGMDPHQRSATTEVVDQAERMLSVGRCGTDRAGYAEVPAAGREFPGRVWAVGGCNGIGRHIAHRLVHDAKRVMDVPPKLVGAGAGVRHRQRPQDRPVGAHSVAMAAFHAPVWCWSSCRRISW